MSLGELIRKAKEGGLLSSLIMELLKDEDAIYELSKYFVMNENGLFLRPIGIVRHGLNDDVIRASSEGVDGVIEVFEEFADGLRGIDGFSHLILISLFNKVNREQRRVLVVKPRRLIKFGINPEELPEVGVFATDSPHRPNPIGLSIVRLIGRDGRFLRVSGLDLFDGTPILDIKPYTPDRSISASDLKAPEWYSRLWRRIGGGVI
ncbi:tRNA (N6-threonylcarbamoyladenosine(37)-N6)-methyltransferase TrmO [Vulcanisaeta sp. JCM 16159]|uniref:tRNA (N6-threonylcarbamoyladenosine(37)-N6)-methyltransferase TrmO n=1 Tax=Vulcanisaeta sp. JCM 16159 TaxID=1295371 RepID=UPI003465CB13